MHISGRRFGAVFFGAVFRRQPGSEDWSRRIGEPLRNKLGGALADLAGPERQLEFVGDLRPVLAEDVPRHIVGNAEANAACRGAETPRVSRMIKIAQRFGAYCPKPLGVIRHELAGITLCYKPVRQSVTDARLRGAFSQAVVARILPEERWVQKDTEKITGRVVSDRGAKAFSIPGSAHAVAGIVTIDLGGGGVPRRADIVQRIRGALHEHVKLV